MTEPCPADRTSWLELRSGPPTVTIRVIPTSVHADRSTNRRAADDQMIRLLGSSGHLVQRNHAGRPAVLHCSGSRCDVLDVSVSYSHGAIAVAVSRGTRCGVDVELLRALPRRSRLERRALSLDEQGPLADDERFLAIWTRKEASLKLIGTGLHVDPRVVSVLRPSERADRWGPASVEGQWIATARTELIGLHNDRFVLSYAVDREEAIVTVVTESGSPARFDGTPPLPSAGPAHAVQRGTGRT